MQFVFDTENQDLAGYTVILSLPSTGNVGQLAADAIVTNFGAKRIGYVDAGNIILSVVGNDAFELNLPSKKSKAVVKVGELNTAAEIFSIEDKKIILVHIRSPITQPKRFAELFLQAMKSQLKTTQLVVLYSANSAWRKDKLINESTEDAMCVRSVIQGTGSLPASSIESIVPPLEQEDRALFIRGVAKFLLKACQETCKDVDVLLLVAICSEGENVGHGLNLAKVVSQVQLKSTSVEQWKIPSSWKALYGDNFGAVSPLYY